MEPMNQSEIDNCKVGILRLLEGSVVLAGEGVLFAGGKEAGREVGGRFFFSWRLEDICRREAGAVRIFF